MKKKLYITLFVTMIVSQLGVPASMIAKREITLQFGESYRFHSQPADPYGAFRGKFVRLGVTAGSAATWEGPPLNAGQDVYVMLHVDEDGFAQGKEISLTHPDTGAYIQAKFR